MKEIASAFGTPLEKIEADLISLITDGAIKAKIDSHKKLLYSRKDNTQLAVFKKAIKVGNNFISDTEDALLKM